MRAEEGEVRMSVSAPVQAGRTRVIRHTLLLLCAAAAIAASVFAVARAATSADPTCQSGSVTFTATGAEQCYTVPAHITILHVSAVGAPGASGGKGANVKGDVTVPDSATPTTLYVRVGGAGSGSSGGFNGGANGGGGGIAGFGGGGATDLRTCSAATCAFAPNDSRLLVAAGGGGKGGGSPSLPCYNGYTNCSGGPGGAAGSDGGNGDAGFAVAGGRGGGAGTASAGGAGGQLGYCLSFRWCLV